ncbi:hypothetical protein KCV87_00130 [Actinosynnema pretiosum subsp. pretiosum]|uniref:Uncharacterized protein n=1 Tax=Actinosynnema pretiosum subsp. pretiosum TaxID=103721 RepID=A0AA45L7Q0_9PSEU|nr:hypothetical protein KCV87_00130 [Actinosynnema pretiosum subsp. pretiosum]
MSALGRLGIWSRGSACNADDPVIDLRVDGSRDPVGDLGRLLTVARAHRRLVRSAMARVAEVEPKALRWARVSAERAAREGNPHAAALLDRVDQPPRVR